MTTSDRDQGIIRDNVAARFHRELPSYGYAKSPEQGQKITDIVAEMFLAGQAERLVYKESVYMDQPSLPEACDQVAIALGVSSDQFSPYLRDLGHQIAICL